MPPDRPVNPTVVSRGWPWFWHWFKKEWRSILLVSAIVFLAHDHLAFIDGYALVWIGNLVIARAPTVKNPKDCGHLLPKQAASPRVVAVEINQADYDARYLARSPLDRCRLKTDLRRVYDAKPDVLVVDIDLSPAEWLTENSQDPQAACQRELYELIKDFSSLIPTPTVLMEPFEPEKTKEWRKDMKAAGLTFGGAHIPVSFGLALRSDTHPESLVGAAYEAYERLHPKEIGEGTQHGGEAIVIDPRKYRGKRSILAIPLCCLADDARPHSLRGHVAFFGAAYGSEGDTFLTPVGEIYGVEVHAASLLSMLEPPPGTRLLGPVLDFIFAVAFGLMLTLCWDGYSKARRYGGRDELQLSAVEAVDMAGSVMSHQELVEVVVSRWVDARAVRELAGLMVLGFCGGVAILVVAVVFVSALLLHGWGVWTSPVPIMAGMLIDSLAARWREDSSPDEGPGDSEGSGERAKTSVRDVAMRAWRWVYAAGLWEMLWVAGAWVTFRRVVWMVVVLLYAAGVLHELLGK
jgi:CHASE2 domain-containing sensor protein